MRRFAPAAFALGGVILVVSIAAVVSSSGGSGGCSGPAGPVAGAPPQLVPVYRAAASRYDLGMEGPSVLAAINDVETSFGHNLSVSSAGAVGWMQFEPATWAMFGVTPIGTRAPVGPIGWNNPLDAIFTAANYLHASGAPSNWPGAVLTYNHSQAYVDQVLSLAQTYLTKGVPRGTSLPATTTCTGVPAGGYINAFARSTALVPQRIDMGVDYDGTGPIDAIGPARVTFAGADPGWAGGNSVNYELLSGQFRGRDVYVAEAVTPTVSAGQTVAAGQPIATFGHGFSTNSIEIGWAAGPGRPSALANVLRQADYSGGDIGSFRTFCGQQFSDLLHTLGAPSGLQNQPLSGQSCA